MHFNQQYSLLTDLYQLTMAYAHWKNASKHKNAIFYMYFRSNPFQSGYTVFSGLEYIKHALQNYQFQEAELRYLSSIKDNQGGRLFEEDFLDYLRRFRFEIDIDAVAEGTIVFPLEPLIRVQGSLLQCQMLETMILNLVNFSTLVTTKATRICSLVKEEPVLEFGMRRAQGVDGAITASRAAYIGGCSGTSNVLAGYIHDIPVKGTHSHSWVNSFENELEAFQVYGQSFPNNCVFLVDTYETSTGIQNAIQAAKDLPNPQKNFLGIRIDSGDLSYFSKMARRMLDNAGFPNAKIFASNSLDETIIRSLQDQGAKINVWAVGTKLVTCENQASLNGVYKLSAFQDEKKNWKSKIKISEDAGKINLPGRLQTRRYYKGNRCIGDIIFNEFNYPENTENWHSTNITNPIQHYSPKVFDSYQDLLEPVVRKGKIVGNSPSIHEIRNRVKKELNLFDDSIKRFINPHLYPAGVEDNLYHQFKQLISECRTTTLS